ncbi:MAG: hypothetical protein AAF467_19895 [Actinomycetota bacterium]
MLGRALNASFLVAGGPGAGKSTFVRSISEIEPRWVTAPDAATPTHEFVDVTDEATAVDYGRLSLDEQAVLHLYAIPSARLDDFAPMAIGATTVIDPRDLGSAQAAMTRVESAGLPHVAVLNTFGRTEPTVDVRAALDLSADTPLICCDAVDPEAVKNVLLTLLAEILTGMRTRPEASR